MTVIWDTKNEGVQEVLSPVQVVTPHTWEGYKKVCAKVITKTYIVTNRTTGEVFIEEQKRVSTETFDEIDEQPTTVHFTISNTKTESKDDIVGICRIYPCGPYVKLGRVAVLKEHRGRGLGEILTLAALKYSQNQFPLHTFIAHSQVQKLDFYARIGFLVVSEVYNNEEVISWQRTMFYPNSNKECLLMTQSFPELKCGVAGDCYDPIVMERMRNIMCSSFVPLSSLLPSISLELGETRRQLMHVAYSIQNEQMKLYPELLEVNFHPKCLPLSEAKSGLEELLLEGNLKSAVSDHWLLFYTAVKLCAAVLMETEQKLKKCLSTVEKNVLIGRQESHCNGRLMSEYATMIHTIISEMK